MSVDRAFEQSPVLQALVDVAGVVTRANAAFLETLGTDLVGQPIEPALAAASSGLASFVRRLLAKGAGFKVDDVLLRSAAAHDLRVEAHGIGLGPDAGFLLLFIDQTQHVTTGTARAQRERSETIARFSGGLSHDMNNMLSTIVSTAQAGLEDVGEGVGDPAKDFRAIIDFAERGAALARSLRSIAFDETGSWRPVALAEEVRAIAAVLGRGSSGVPIVLDLDDGIAEVVGDRARLHQLVLNLLVNARDATRTHGGGIEVELRRTASGGVRLAVADSGPGIPVELRTRIFEPYFTTKDQREEGEALGTGLGLAIVDAVARATGASVRVDSSRTGGALFVVEWPVTAVLRVEPVTAVAKDPIISPAMVLLADDESALVGAVARQLRRVGHSVYAAMSAAESRRIFANFKDVLDVAVIDVRLGDGDGRELADEFLAARPDLGVVLISASATRVAAPSGGALRFLSKPFDFKELTAAIEDARRRPAR